MTHAIEMTEVKYAITCCNTRARMDSYPMYETVGSVIATDGHICARSMSAILAARDTTECVNLLLNDFFTGTDTEWHTTTVPHD